MANTWSVKALRSKGGNWSVYFVTSEGTQHLIEGGFFSKRAAEACAEQARKDALQSVTLPEVEDA